MKRIKLTKGFYAKVDDSDYEWLNKWKWYALKNITSGYFYAVREECHGKRSRTHFRMHRIIMNPKKDQLVDHINHDTLDNRRENLRLCTHAENGQNRKANKNNTSGYKGVTWDKCHRLWMVMIKADGKSRTIGYSHSKEDAARMYNEAALKYHGNFAYLNRVI